MVLLAGCAQDEPVVELTGRVVDPPLRISATPLTDTDGSEFSLADTDARLTLLFFGYTKCPDICPVVMSNVTSGLQRLDDADRDQVDVVFVTTDPARDDAQTLRTWLDRLDPSFVGLTGDLDDIVAIAKSVAIYVDAEELASGGLDLGAHGAQVMGIDGGGEVPVFWPPDTTAAQFAADIEVLLGEI